MNRGDLLNPGNKKFWLLMGAVLLGITLMLLGGSGSGDTMAETGRNHADTQLSGRESTVYSTASSIMTAEEREIAAGLQRMLEQIAGAGRVEVAVQLATSTYNDFATNNDSGIKKTVEEDQNGGTREITENTGTSTVVITGEGQGLEKPVISREVAPEVAGVLVVAEGAGEPAVKAGLFRAVQVSLGIQPHKIAVMNMKRGDSFDQGH